MRLMERDLKILAKSAVSRWLTTGQIGQAYFPGATPDAVRKRLRRLAEEGYLVSWREHQMAEALFAVGPKGKEVLGSRGFELECSREPPKQLEHLVGINDIRLSIERAGVSVAYVFAAWELAGLGWQWRILPDVVFALAAPLRRSFVVEYDRGSETLETLLSKARAYEEGLSGFSFEGLLVVTDTEGRRDAFLRELRKRQHSLRIWVSTLGEVRESGILAPVFLEGSASSSRMSFLAGCD